MFWPGKILLIKQNQYLGSLHLAKGEKAMYMPAFPLNSTFGPSVNNVSPCT